MIRNYFHWSSSVINSSTCQGSFHQDPPTIVDRGNENREVLRLKQNERRNSFEATERQNAREQTRRSQTYRSIATCRRRISHEVEFLSSETVHDAKIVKLYYQRGIYTIVSGCCGIRILLEALPIARVETFLLNEPPRFKNSPSSIRLLGGHDFTNGNQKYQGIVH